MSQKSVILVQESWKRLAAIGPVVVGIFHKNLVDANPGYKSLFDGFCNGATDTRDILVMRTTTKVIENLGDAQVAAKFLQQLGHIGYKRGIHDHHFDDFEAALVKTLGELLDNDFSEALKSAWIAAFRFAASCMKLANGSLVAATEAAHFQFAERRRQSRRSSVEMGGSRCHTRRLHEHAAQVH